ncbi:MAG TPA: hypothetical protein VJB15_07115, partial [Rhodothermia bacterium]|nr:hypothetical protein [Rhodothermia bacterium]
LVDLNAARRNRPERKPEEVTLAALQRPTEPGTWNLEPGTWNVERETLRCRSKASAAKSNAL